MEKSGVPLGGAGRGKGAKGSERQYPSEGESAGRKPRGDAHATWGSAALKVEVAVKREGKRKSI